MHMPIFKAINLFIIILESSYYKSESIVRTTQRLLDMLIFIKVK